MMSVFQVGHFHLLFHCGDGDLEFRTIGPCDVAVSGLCYFILSSVYVSNFYAVHSALTTEKLLCVLSFLYCLENFV